VSIFYSIVKRFTAPSLPKPTQTYDQRYFDALVNVLRLYFNQLDDLLGRIVAVTSATVPVSIGGTNVDAFGRLRISAPYTLFDSQNRYAADNQFDTNAGGSTTYLPNEALVSLDVTGTLGAETVRQSFRSFPYQPGKGLLVLATFVMNAAKSGLRQRIGYFNTQNGVFFQQNDSALAFVLRSNSIPTPGTPSDARTVTQANWNGDKLDGTGVSGYTLDPTKAQILWMDFEWLGVGSVRCGFVINGEYIVCHTFNNANDIASVYMTTAILPVRYEITNVTGTGSSSSLKQICSTVISEGGYEQYSPGHVARRTTALATIGTTFLPLVSIRLSSSALGAVVLPQRVQVLPTTSQNYEVALVKNPTLIRRTATLNNPFATVNGSATVTVTDAGHGGTTGDYVNYSGAAAAGGLTLNGRYQITVLGVNTYTITASTNATATVAAGGGAAVVTTYEISNSAWLSVPTDSNVQYDVSAIAISGGTIVQTDYVTSSGSGGTNPLADPAGYNWDLQLGASLTNVSDIYTVQIRTVSGATTGDAVGSLSFWDLTQ
jgi:hypothetical protein